MPNNQHRFANSSSNSIRLRSKFIEWSTVVLLFVSIVSIVSVNGCKKASSTSSSSKGATQKELAQAWATQQSKNQSARQPKPDLRRIPINEILKRRDLTPEAVVAIKSHRTMGFDSMTLDEVERTIAKSMAPTEKLSPRQRVVKSSFATYNRPAIGMLPTKATTTPSNAEVVYKKHQGAGPKDHKLAWISSLLPAVEHFKAIDHQLVSAAGKQTAADLLQHVIESNAADADVDWQDLKEQHRQLRNQHAGLRWDPLFIWCIGSIEQKLGNYGLARKTLGEAIEKFETSSYPARFVVHVHQMRAFTKNSDPKKGINEYAQRFIAIDYWLESDFRATPDEHQAVQTVISSFIGEMTTIRDIEMLKYFEARLSRHIHLSEWLRNVIRGQLLFEIGWMHRGGGTADTVNKDQWQLFHSNLTEAAKFYRRAHDANPDSSHAATKLMSIALSGQIDDPIEDWFEKAIERNPDEIAAHNQRLTSLLPQWGGSPEAMIAFSIEYSKSDAPNSRRPLLALNCLYRLKYQAIFPDEKTKEKHVNDPQLIQRCLEVVSKFASDNKPIVYRGVRHGPKFWLTAKTLLAIRLGKHAIADETFDQLKGKIDTKALNTFGNASTSFAVFRSRNYSLTSEYASEATELIKLTEQPYKIRMENTRKIIQLCDKVLAENTNPVGSLFFKKAKAIAILERSYAAGKRVELKFDPELTNWEFHDISQIEYVSEDEIKLDTRTTKPFFQIKSAVTMPGAKIIECDLEMPLEIPRFRKPYLNLMPGVDEFTQDFRTHENRWRDFYSIGIGNASEVEVERRKTKLRWGRVWVGNDRYYKVNLIRPVNHIKIIAAFGYAEVYVNDEFIFRTTLLKGPRRLLDVASSFQVSNYGRMGRGVAKYSNIRVQKLNADAPPVGDSPIALIDYYTHAIAQTPNDKWATFWLGHAYHFSEKHEQAVEYYEKAIELGVDKQFASFWLGDAFDQLGETEKAVTCYEIAALNITKSITEQMNWAGAPVFGNHNQWASFRLGCHHAFRLNQPFDQSKNCYGIAPNAYDWVDTLRKCQNLAAKGEFDKAIEYSKSTLSQAPAAVEPEILKLIRAYQAKTVPTLDEDQPQFYTQVKNGLTFFQTFEGLLTKRQEVEK